MDSALLHFKRLRLLDVVDYETRALCLLSACIVSRTDSGTWARRKGSKFGGCMYYTQVR